MLWIALALVLFPALVGLVMVGKTGPNLCLISLIQQGPRAGLLQWEKAWWLERYVVRRRVRSSDLSSLEKHLHSKTSEEICEILQCLEDSFGIPLTPECKARWVVLGDFAYYDIHSTLADVAALRRCFGETIPAEVLTRFDDEAFRTAQTQLTKEEEEAHAQLQFLLAQN